MVMDVINLPAPRAAVKFSRPVEHRANARGTRWKESPAPSTTAMVKRGEMMTAADVVDILSIPLIGIVPDDENVVIATNQGEPLVGNGTMAGRAYQNICERILGREIPFIDFEKTISFWTRVTGIFHKN